MIIRFERDDLGYVAWLAAHPNGWVLNTYMHVSSDYLLLHRARCRTVNRPLVAGRTWTYAYGKACSEDRTEVEAWALREGGRPAQPCQHCLRGDSHFVAATTVRQDLPDHSRGPRGPRQSDSIAMNGSGITIRIVPMASVAPHAPPLVIEGAQWLAETFFRQDPSAVGRKSYDAWIETTQGDPDRRERICDDDITAVNTTMAARTSHENWAKVITENDWTWLSALDRSWSLFEMSDEEWQNRCLRDRLRVAFAAVHRPGLGIAVVTKVLHIKRPRLFPVLDSLVIGQLAGRYSEDVETWVAIMEHVRTVGRENLDGLRAIRAHLIEAGLPERSLVRILDSLLWTSAPGSVLFGQLSDWERVFRPRLGSPAAVLDVGEG